MLEQMAKRGTTLTSTLTVGARFSSMNSVDYENDPRLRYICQGLGTWSPTAGRRKPPSAGSPACRQLRDQRGTELIPMAQKLGEAARRIRSEFVTLCLPGWSLHEELERW